MTGLLLRGLDFSLCSRWEREPDFGERSSPSIDQDVGVVYRNLSLKSKAKKCNQFLAVVLQWSKEIRIYKTLSYCLSKGMSMNVNPNSSRNILLTYFLSTTNSPTRTPVNLRRQRLATLMSGMLS